MKIKIRELKESDHEEIISIIDRTWDYREYGMPDDLCYLKAKRDLLQSLGDSNIALVAEYDNRVIGFLIGRNQNLPDDPIRKGINKKVDKITEKLEQSRQGRMFNEYAQLFKKMNSKLTPVEFSPDAEIIYLAVDPQFRGLKIGVSLIKTFNKTLTSSKVKDIILYTDSVSNFNFYQAQGFEKLDENTAFSRLRKTDISFFIYRLKL